MSLSVEPVAGAKDYRVYVLPADGDVTTGADGLVTIANATYRCAGNRQTPGVAADGATVGQSEAIKTLVDNQDVEGYRRPLAEATLGFVYVTPGAGRVPVYAMGDPAPDADNACFHQRWAASRVKKYVTAEAERTQLLDQRWRDDGIAFYAPAPGAAGTKPVYTTGGAAPLFYVDGAEATQRGSGAVAFQALDAAGDADTAPLMRVYYQNGCGKSHDELVAGQARFERARFQGDDLPLFDLHWSGLTAETTLVVEALDQGCPYQGLLAPVSRAAATEDGIAYPAFLTLDEARAASASGELFINGQHAATNRPRAIARSFVKIAPGPRPDLDWYAGFGPDEAPDFMALGFDAPCGNPLNVTCGNEFRQISDFGDVSFSSATGNRNGIGVVLGELWVTYADVGADIGGKFRFSPTPKATMSANAYLHVTMEVDDFTTARRYPQILISDGATPVQYNFTTSNTLNLQTFPDTGTGNWPFLFQVQVCDHRPWEVNNQCPSADLYRLAADGTTNGLAPIQELGELTGVDRTTRLDAFLSTKRAYVFVDGQPYGCSDLPARGIPSGQVSVTFGDVIYHSGVDQVFGFHEERQKVVAKRHFDNLGFKSNAAAPAWNEKRFPCAPASAIK